MYGRAPLQPDVCKINAQATKKALNICWQTIPQQGGGSKSVLIYIHNSILRTSDNHTKHMFVSVHNWTEHLFTLERCTLTAQWLHSRPASICQAQSSHLTHETEAFATAVVGQGAGDSPSEMNCAIGRSRQSPTLSGCIESGGVQPSLL